MESVSRQVVDAATGTAYVLVTTTDAAIQGPWVLRRTDLRTGSVRVGAAGTLSSVSLASGYLWIYGDPGPGSQPAISQVNSVTLKRIRSIALPPQPANFGVPSLAVAPGPDDSVWIGSYQTLLQVSAATGLVMTRMTLPADLAVSDVAADPADGKLYVSAARVVNGNAESAVLLEYGARSGRQLATASSGLITYSVAGAALTAVPGGVWASFRTGMLGLTIHLGQQSLQMIKPPGPRIAQSPPGGVFHWPMYASAIYGGGALWLANQTGIVTCLNPRTGKVRAGERLSQSRLISQLLGVDLVTHTVFALSTGELVQISPPRQCWA